MLWISHLLLLFVLASSGCGNAPGKSASSQGAAAPNEASEVEASGRLRVTVSVDWEGAYLSSEGLEELTAFRKALPQVPITHWICPAYLSKPDSEYDLKKALATHVHEKDEVSLHLHGWATLARAAGVEPRSGPSFFDASAPLTDFGDDEGFELELGAYSRDEMQRILGVSKKLLASAGVKVLPMFRGGAGILEDHVLAAIVGAGFAVDTSLIPAQFWRTEHEAPAQLGKRVQEIWGQREDFVEPFWIETAQGRLLEIPSAPGFGDYASVEQLTDYIDEAIARLRHDPKRDVYVHLGFHQENADMGSEIADYTFRLRIQKAIEYIDRQYPELVVYEGMSEVARRYGARL